MFFLPSAKLGYFCIKFTPTIYLYYRQGWKNIYYFIFQWEKWKEKKKGQVTEIEEYMDETKTKSQVPEISIPCQNKPFHFTSTHTVSRFYRTGAFHFPRRYLLHWNKPTQECLTIFYLRITVLESLVAHWSIGKTPAASPFSFTSDVSLLLFSLVRTLTAPSPLSPTDPASLESSYDRHCGLQGNSQTTSLMPFTLGWQSNP